MENGNGNAGGARKNVILDIDGTMWDAIPQIFAAWEAAFREFPENHDLKISEELKMTCLGHTAPEIAEMFFPEVPEERRLAFMKAAEENEVRYLPDHPGMVYPGFTEAVRLLHEKGYGIYVVSNCQNGYVAVAVRAAGIEDIVSDSEWYARTKLPKSGSIKLLMERNGLKPEDCVYVGDIVNDEYAAHDAGIRFIHAAYGFGGADRPEAVIRTASELPAAVASLFQP